MLIDFEVENFRSYREPKRFSFVASAIKEFPQNLIEIPDQDIKLLKTAAIYGPNGSGKSNLLLAMYSLSILLDSPMNRRIGVGLSPFVLDQLSATMPTRFQVRFLADGTLFEYALTVKLDLIQEERLIAYPKGRPQEWFSRLGPDIEFKSPNLKGQKKSLSSITSTSSPFLAVAFAFDHPQLSIPAQWLTKNLGDRFDSPGPRNRFFSSRSTISEEVTARRFQSDPDFRRWADHFMRHADIGIQKLGVKVVEQKVRKAVRPRRTDETDRPPVIQEVTEEEHRPFFIHSGEGGTTAEFELWDESQGTRRLFSMLAPMYQALKHGEIAVIDELSASLHPTLVRHLIQVFHDSQSNPNNAQLLFATHDTSLLNGRMFRRDQVWFTEKSPIGSTDLYSLHDIKVIRSEEAFEDGYLRGRYGAIPFFNKFDFPPTEQDIEAGSKDETGTDDGSAEARS